MREIQKTVCVIKNFCKHSNGSCAIQHTQIKTSTSDALKKSTVHGSA